MKHRILLPLLAFVMLVTNSGLPITPPHPVQAAYPNWAPQVQASRIAAPPSIAAVCGDDLVSLSSGDIYLPMIASGANTRTAVTAPDTAASAAPNQPTALSNSGTATNFYEATRFIHGGANAAQRTVHSSLLAPETVSVIRGTVTGRDGSPLSNVSVHVDEHREYGTTQTDANGRFNLAVNGGETLTLCFNRAGYLPAQRQATPTINQYDLLETVALVQLDQRVTTIDLDSPAPMQAMQGSPVTDEDGTRQSTLLFPAGTSASMTTPDGITTTLQTINVRTTEYTVGENGPNSMPSDLPANSGYTYALEFSLDEALAVGAEQVDFNQPLYYYVENFLGFDVGMPVPVGYYDRGQDQWIGVENGRIIEITTIENGAAQLDFDGDGQPEDAETLATYNVTLAEQMQLAALYTAGDTLWRIPIEHFTPYDPNWPFGPPNPPPNPPNENCNGPCTSPNNNNNGDNDDNENECNQSGSIIECQNQVLGERIAITGTPFSLNYRSSRVPGFVNTRTIQIPLIGDGPIRDDLKRIDVEIFIGGREFAESFEPAPNQTFTFTWDGLDAFGRPLYGTQTALVRLGNAYDGRYREPGETAISFGEFGGQVIDARLSRQEFVFWSEWETPVYQWDARGHGLGGWMLSGHHSFDPNGAILRLGDGRTFNYSSAKSLTSLTGNDSFSSFVPPEVGQPVSDHPPYAPSSVSTAPNGDLYFSSGTLGNVRPYIVRVNAAGIIAETWGHGDTYVCQAEQGLSVDEIFFDINVRDITYANDGAVYFVSSFQGCAGRITAERTVEILVAPGGDRQNLGDGGPALDAYLDSPTSIAVGPDGSVYIGESQGWRVRRIAPSGLISTFAGGGPQRPGLGDGELAAGSYLGSPLDIVTTQDGSVYISTGETGYDARIRQVTPDGLIRTVAGGGLNRGDDAEGAPATEMNMGSPSGLAIGPDGLLHFSDTTTHSIYKIDEAGLLIRVAGTRTYGYSEDGAAALQAQFKRPRSLAFTADGTLYIAESDAHSIRRLGRGTGQGLRTIDPNGQTVIRLLEPNGGYVYVFDTFGRHLRTENELTGATMYTFGYDATGRLTTVTDPFDNTTTINHDSNGNPTEIVGPYGQTTTLSVDGNGYLNQVTSPVSATYQMSYENDGGLLATFTQPNEAVSSFSYDNLGRLVEDDMPGSAEWILGRIDSTSGYTVTMTSGTGQTISYNKRTTADGVEQYVTTNPDGSQITAEYGADNESTITYGDGTTTRTVEEADPIWGMQVPLPALVETTLPSGVTLIETWERQVRLADPADPSTLEMITDTVTIDGIPSVTIYDMAQGTLTYTSPEGKVSVTHIDDTGRTEQIVSPGMVPVAYGYDERGRLTTFSQSDGTTERQMTYGYDDAGNLATITNPFDQTRTIEYDAAGRPIREVQPDGSAIRYSYDANGNQTSITPPGRAAHTFVYDEHNDPVSYTAPSVGQGSSTTTYSHNADGRITQVNFPGNQTVNYGYNATTGQLENVTLPRGTTTFSYDPTSGQVTSASDPSGVNINWSYDGSLLNGFTWDGTVNGSVSWVYNNRFEPTQYRVNNANPITFGYDDDGLLAQAGDLTITRQIDNGWIETTTLGQVTESWEFNSFAEPVRYTAAYNNAVYFELETTYDALGRIATQQETAGGVTTTTSYSYDANGRLATVRENGTLSGEYSYAVNNNRQLVSGPAAVYDAQDRLTSLGNTSYSYTPTGELLSQNTAGQLTQYDYDVMSNLLGVTLPNGDEISYVVDSHGRRVGKQLNGTLVQGWLYMDGLNPIAELDGNGNILSRFVYGTRSNVPAYMIRDGQTYRIIPDYLGSPRQVINVTTGDIVQEMRYDAWGNVLEDSNPGFQPFGFGGGLYDADTGLVRFGARDYDAQSGRWTTKDPILFLGRDTNLYAYSANDPINMLDLDGLFVSGGLLAGGAVATGAGAGAGAGVGAGAGLGAAIAAPLGLAAIGGMTIGTVINHFISDFIQKGLDKIFGGPKIPPLPQVDPKDLPPHPGPGESPWQPEPGDGLPVPWKDLPPVPNVEPDQEVTQPIPLPPKPAPKIPPKRTRRPKPCK